MHDKNIAFMLHKIKIEEATSALAGFH